MLKTILSISGKPGLFKLVSQGKNMLIVESLVDKRRMPAYARDKVISLGDIAIYTTEEEVPLHEVLTMVKNKENGEKVASNITSSKPDELRNYFAEILPNFDRERVYPSDIKKLFSWYNLLVENGITEFAPEEEKAEEKAEEPKAEEAKPKEVKEKKEKKEKKETEEAPKKKARATKKKEEPK